MMRAVSVSVSVSVCVVVVVAGQFSNAGTLNQ